MIPQRNISLLSNRLAAGSDMRIREDVLERDYCLAWFLCCLAQSELRAVLAFKGGTALKRCYFADYRFSKDLDFTLREPLPFEEIRARLERVYAAIQEQSGITFAVDREDRQAHANSYTFYLGYTGPLPRAMAHAAPHVCISPHRKWCGHSDRERIAGALQHRRHDALRPHKFQQQAIGGRKTRRFW